MVRWRSTEVGLGPRHPHGEHRSHPYPMVRVRRQVDRWVGRWVAPIHPRCHITCRMAEYTEHDTPLH